MAALSLILFTALSMNTMIACAATAQAQMQVSAQGVATISFRMIDEPDDYQVEDDGENDQEGSDHEGSQHANDHHKEKSHMILIKDHIELAVTSNSIEGYALVIEALEYGPYRGARIRIKGRKDIHLHAGESARVIIREGVNKRGVIKLKIILTVFPDAKPGRYPWPINVFAIPL